MGQAGRSHTGFRRLLVNIERVVWHVIREYAAGLNLASLAPRDLCRSCARLCHTARREMEQIQFVLGHASVQATEKYVGCKQRFRGAVNDGIGIEPYTVGGLSRLACLRLSRASEHSLLA